MTSRRATRRQRGASPKAGERKRAAAGPPPPNVVAPFAASVALLLLVAIVYQPVGEFQFISLDDPQYVSANAIVQQGLTLAGTRWAFLTTSFYWHPLTWISHMLDVELFGLDAGAHHLVNAALHAFSTVLLFLALRKMTSRLWESAFVAAFFAVHPLHVESVAWIAERKDVLSTCFFMGALYAYAVYAERPTWRRMAGVAGLFTLGLLAKPMIVTLPFVLLLLDYWPLRRFQLEGERWYRELLRLAREKTFLFLLSMMSVAITVFSQRGSSSVVALEALPWFDRVGNAIVSYAVYMRDMLWPVRLGAFYPLTRPAIVAVLTAFAILMVISAAAWRSRRNAPWILVGWLWYLGTLIPVIGLLQAGDQGRADRFTYVPLIGLFIGITWFASDKLFVLAKTRLAFSAIAVAFTVALSMLSRQQVMFWKDDLTVWGRAVAVTKDNYRAENHLGIALTDRGQIDDGIRHYETALRIWPDYAEARNNLGTARMDQLRFKDAVNEFSAAARLKPNNSMFRYNLAVALDADGRRAEAIEEVRRGLKADPSHRDLLRARDAFGITR